MNTRKTVAIAVIESGNEGEALRQTLEYFGYLVVMYWVGRPQDFIDILAGNTLTKYDYIIISAHGEENGEIIMPELGEDIYFPNEPRGNFGFNEISKHLALTDTCIIGSGCWLGQKTLAEAFAKNNNTYIAPKSEIDGTAALAFITLFFYYISDRVYSSLCGFDIKTAYKKAADIDSQAGLFTLYQ